MPAIHKVDLLQKLLLLSVVGWGILQSPLGVIHAAPIQSQKNDTAANLPGFDVVSIKPEPSDAHRESRTTVDTFSAKLTTENLISAAYGLQMEDQISGLPKWADSELFHIEAKMDEATVTSLRGLSEELYAKQRQLLLQSLLATRFGLRVHHEIRELPVYALVVAKGGSRLKESAANTSVDKMVGRGRLTAKGLTTQSLADTLSHQTGRIVLDRTGLTASYDMKLRWAEEGADESLPAEDSAPSLFTALQEQLGLKLDSTKGPVDVIVIDHIEKPSTN
jgi:uncharacterized protein (TIGR03435 family)